MKPDFLINDVVILSRLKCEAQWFWFIRIYVLLRFCWKCSPWNKGSPSYGSEPDGVDQNQLKWSVSEHHVIIDRLYLNNHVCWWGDCDQQEALLSTHTLPEPLIQTGSGCGQSSDLIDTFIHTVDRRRRSHKLDFSLLLIIKLITQVHCSC